MSDVTIVTAYYRVPAKHSDAEYDAWIERFAKTLDNPVVFFGEDKWCERFKSLRDDRPTVCKVLPIKELTSHKLADWHSVWVDDFFRELHSTALYAIWNEKPMFVQRAISENPFQSKYFAWMDAGCVREHGLITRHWPNGGVLKEEMNHGKICIAQAVPIPNEDRVIDEFGMPVDFHGRNYLSAAMMLGPKEAWGSFTTEFYNLLRKYHVAGRHCGLDQNVLSGLAILRPDLIRVIDPYFDNKWFGLHQYFHPD